MCAFSLLNLQTSGWPQQWLNSSCSESIMTSVIFPLVLQGLFAVLIKEADWWLGMKPGCVGILYACYTVQFEKCMCVFRQAWRTAEVERWSLNPIGVSTHATDSVTLTSIMTLGLIPEECSRGKRWEIVARRMIQLGCGSTTRCKSYSSMLLWAICFQPSVSDRIFCELPRIHWRSEGLLCLFLTLSLYFLFQCCVFVIPM